MALEEKIVAYKELSEQIDLLEERKKALGQEIAAEMTTSSLKFANYKATRYVRLSISMLLDQARLLNATKTQEVIDRKKIKELYYAGQVIDGVKEAYTLMVHKLTTSEER